MALTDKNIVITPNIGAASDPKIVFSGADASTAAQNITLTAYPTNGGTLSFDGSTGQLFSVTNSMSDTIFSANDVSGIPSIEVLDTGVVKIAQYSGNLLLGSGADTGLAKLQVTGNISATGTIAATGINIGNANQQLLSSTWAGTAGYPGYQYTGADSRFGFSSTSGGVDVYADGNFYATPSSHLVLHAGNYNSYSPTLTGGAASGTWGISISGSLTSSAPQLAAATESNSIYITAPSYTTDTPVKLINFDWYSNIFSIGNIRGGGAGSNGFGVYYTTGGTRTEIARFGTDSSFSAAGALKQGTNQVLHAGNYTSYSPSLTGGSASGSWGINVTGNAATASAVTMSAARTDSTAYPVVWATTGGTSQMYSATAVNIQSSTGTLNATLLNAGSGGLNSTYALGDTVGLGVGSLNLYSDTTTSSSHRLQIAHIRETAGATSAGTYDQIARLTSTSTKGGFIRLRDDTTALSDAFKYSVSFGIGSSGEMAGFDTYGGLIIGTPLSGSANPTSVKLHVMRAGGSSIWLNDGSTYAATSKIGEINSVNGDLNLVADRLNQYASSRISLKVDNTEVAYVISTGLVSAGTISGTNLSGTNTGDNAGVTSVTATTPIVSSGGTTPNITHALSGVTAGTYNNVTVNTTGHVTAGSNTAYITGNQTITLTGDATGSGTTSIAVTVGQIDGWAFANTGSNLAINANTLGQNGITYYNAGVDNFTGNASDGALYSQFYSSSWEHQIAGDFREGNIAVRGKNSGTWARWKSIPTIAISDTAPLNETKGDMWWQSSTGKLKLYYDDGTSSQWVDALPIPDVSTFYSKAGGGITGPVVVNSSLTVTGTSYLTGLTATNIITGSISGNAATVGGFTPTASNGVANRVVVADANGYIQNNYFYTSGGGSERSASGMAYFAGFNSSDYYIRSYTAAAVAAAISGQTMNIAGSSTSCSGNAATATTATNLSNFTNQSGARYATDFNTILTTGFYNAESTPTNSPGGSYGQLIVAKGIDTGLQIYSGYNNDNLWFRGWGSSGGTFFNGWRTVLHNGNYNSYSPTLTGGSASGTWGISITGNAATTSQTTFSEVYSNGWLRNNNNNTGLYNTANGNHFYSRAANRWGITGNSATSNIYLDFYATHENTIRGSVHADTVNNIGFLTPSGGWSFMVSSVGNATATGTITGTNLSGTNTGDNAGVTSVSGTAPVVSSGGTAPAISMAAASAGVNGYMTGAYATKLDGIATGATANTGTVTGVTGTAPVVSSGGTAPAISMAAATTSVAGYLTAANWTTFNNKQSTGLCLLLAGGTMTGNITYRQLLASPVNTISGDIITLATGAINNSGGNLAIYTITGAALKLMVNGGTTVGVTIATTGDMTCTGNITAYSDLRLKTDLKVIPDAISKVKQLTGYTYTRTDSNQRQTGLVAQDVQKVLPEAVLDGEYLSLAYGNIVGLLVEAIKEQQTIIDSQESRIARLETLVSKLIEG